jgi:hypothetical protein
MSEKHLNGAGGRIAERAVGERGGVAAARAAREGVADPELVERAKRRRFTTECELRILRQAEACAGRVRSAPGCAARGSIRRI